MNTNELIDSMADMIQVMLSQEKEKEEEKLFVCVQVISFFNEIFNTLSPNDDLSKLKLAEKEYWNYLASCASCINKNPDEAQNIAKFIDKFVQASIIMETYDNIANFYIELIKFCVGNSSAGNHFINSLKVALQATEIKNQFFRNDGILASVTQCIEGGPNSLVSFVFEIIKENIDDLSSESYFDTTMDFISLVTMSFHKLTVEYAKFFTDIICEIIKRNIKHLKTSVDCGLFQTISKYIIKVQSTNGCDTSLISKFAVFSDDIGSIIPPAVVSMIETATNEQCSQDLHRNLLKDIKEYNENIKTAVLSNLYVSQLVFSTTVSDLESIVMIEDMVNYLVENKGFDSLPVTPGLIKFCNKDLVMKIDISHIINVFVLLADSFSPFARTFFFPFITEMDTADLIEVFNRYPDIITLISTNSLLLPDKKDEIKLITKFISVYDKISEKERAKKSLVTLFQNEYGLLLINDIIESFIDSKQNADSFLEIIICMARESLSFHAILRKDTLEEVLKLYNDGLIANSSTLDFISSISEKKYMYEYNKQMSEYLPTVNYFGATPEMLTRFAFGKPCNSEDGESHSLLFPCVIHKANYVNIRNEFDLVLVALRTEFPELKENPYLTKASALFVTPQIADSIIKTPKLFFEASKERENKDPYFVIDHNGGSFKLANCGEYSEFGLWASIRQENATFLLLLYKGIRITVQNNTLFVNTKSVKSLKQDQDFFIYIKVNSKDCEVFVDTKSEGVYKISESETKIGEDCNESKFVIYSIRFFESKYLEDYQSKMFKAGKNATYPLGEVNSLIPNNYISSKGDIERPKEIVGDSHPVTNNSLASYVRDTLNGFDYIMRIIYKKEDSKENIEYYIKGLINFQKRKETNWTNQEFALRMSSIVPLIELDDSIVEIIVDTFIDEENIDWESLSLFICDFKLFNSNFCLIIIEKLALLKSKNIEFPLFVVNFLLFNLLLNHQYSDLIGKLIQSDNHYIRSKTMYLSCYPHSRNGDFDKKIIKNSLDVGLRARYLFFTLPPECSIRLAMMVSEENITLNLRKDILSALLINCDRKDAWDSALSICTSRRNQNVDSPDLTDFDSALFVDFLPMIAGLAYGSVTADNEWSNRCIRILDQLITCIPKQNRALLDSIKLWLRVFIGMGSKFDSSEPITDDDHCMLVYGINPPSTSLVKRLQVRRSSNENVSKIHHSGSIPDFSDIRKSFTFRKSLDANIQRPDVDNDIKSRRNKLPSPRRVFQAPLSFSKTIKPVTHIVDDNIPSETDESDVSEASVESKKDEFQIDSNSYNIDSIAKDIDEFVKGDVDIYPNISYSATKHEFDESDKEITKVWESFNDLLEHFVKCYHGGGAKNEKVQNAIAHFVASLCIMNSAIGRIVYTPIISLQPKQLSESYFLITMEILSMKPRKTLFRKFCDFILDGWFKEYTLDIISKMCEVAVTEPAYITDSFVNLLVFLPRTIAAVGEIAARSLWTFESDAFRSKIGLVASMAKTCQLIPSMSDINKVLKKDNDFWRKELGIEDEDPLSSTKAMNEAESYCNKRAIKMKERCRDCASASLNENNDFVKSGNAFMSKITVYKSKSLTEAKIIKEKYFQCMDAFLNIFMRDRELLIWKIFAMPVKQSNRSTVSLLSDLALPTRRIDPSPFSYNLPPYPGRGISNIFNVLYNDEKTVEQNLCNAYKMRIPNPLVDISDDVHLSFAWYFDANPKTLQIAAEYLFNQKKPFYQQFNGSILFGIDILKGAFLIIKGSKLIFIEGLNVTKEGYQFAEQQKESLTQRFYADAIIAGYFGSPITLCGHIGFIVDLKELIAVKKHQWLHKPISCLLQFSRGQSFCVILEKSTLNPFIQHMEENVSAFMSQAPPLMINAMSPLTTAHILFDMSLKEITNMWANGSISSFFYLLLLNVHGGRSYSDQTQYFVLPWVIADYNSDNFEETPIRDLTKPMGQLGGERMLNYDRMFEESENSYFYGSHFMHFGVVLYFTFRIDPFCLLSIQLNHGWDHPNRIFVSLDESWRSASHNTAADVKELIPAVYTIPEIFKTDFPLKSPERNAEVVSLPDWAEDGRDFVVKMQQKLETKEVGENLCYWIDLIFGEKSRGEKAVLAKNVFHPLTYSELESTDDDLQREADETCIINFGQCCKQIFTRSHPQQKRIFMSNFDPSQLKFLQKISVDRCEVAYSVDRDVFPGTKNSILLGRNVYELKYPTLGTVKLPQNMPYIELMSATDDSLHLITSTSDDRALISRLQYSKGKLSNVVLLDSLYIGEDITFVCISAQHFIACVCYGKKLMIYDYGTKRILHIIDTEMICNIGFVDDESGLIVIGCSEGVEIFTINGEKKLMKRINGITCVCTSHLPISCSNKYICVGSSDGTVKLLNIETLECINEIKFNSPVRSVHVHENNVRIVVSTEIGVFTVEGLGFNQPLKKNYAVSCAVCNEKLVKSIEICNECSRFVCPKCKAECQSHI